MVVGQTLSQTSSPPKFHQNHTPNSGLGACIFSHSGPKMAQSHPITSTSCSLCHCRHTTPWGSSTSSLLPLSSSPLCSSSWPLPASSGPCFFDLAVFIRNDEQTGYFHFQYSESHNCKSTVTGQDSRFGCPKRPSPSLANT